MMHIYTDPHAGKNLISHTTQDSRKRLREFIALNTSMVVGDFDQDELIICAGDLFDTYQNTEEVLHSTLWACDRTDYILAGNHDVVNILGRKGTLDIVGTVFDGKVIAHKFGKPNLRAVYMSVPPTDDTPMIVMVPHHSNQKLFEEALEACEVVAEAHPGKSILISHCNYNSDFIKDDVALNMTQRHAKKLLKSFEYIFLGHEHNHRTDLDGRLIVVGSPHPTNFGDISDKFVVSWDGEGHPVMKQTWSKSKHYLEVHWANLAENLTPDHQWVKLTGEIPPSEIHSLAKFIRDAWKHYSPFAIKSEVKIIGGEASASDYHAHDSSKISEIIESELKGSPDLYEMWRSITDDSQSET